MKITRNPFIVKGYIDKTTFCDRENELNSLYINLQNGIDTTLISPRRLGKTGLILRFFEFIKDHNPEVASIYVDIYATRSLDDFVKLLVESILKVFPEKSNVGKRFITLLKGLRPMIGYDSISGEPRIQIAYQSPQEKEHTLKSILEFLDKQSALVVLAIDEFQQINDYPEKNTEALLRTCLQTLKNIRFIFCGSKKDMMIDLFSNAKRPFYSSTKFISLDKIDKEIYADFIQKTFEKHHKKIDNESIEFILNWTKRHTFYTQYLCNLVFTLSEEDIHLNIVKEACVQILMQNETVYLQYRQLLTPSQWNFLIAVAKEDEVNQITSQKFIQTHRIGTPANARRISKSLEEKELLLVNFAKKSQSYQVYDVFFSRWLEREY